MNKKIFGILMALLLVSGNQAVAQPQANPASLWSLNSKECSLWRSYGSGRTKTRLGIRPALTWESARVFIIYQGATVPNRWAQGHFRAGNSPEMPIDFIDFPSTGAGERFIKLELPAATMKTASHAPSWRIRGELQDFEFALDGLESVFPAVERCIADQQTKMGFDDASLARVVQAPKVDLQKYFATGDYPVIAADLGISGRTQVRVLVNSNGKVADCYVTQGSGNAVLDYVTCETFLREAKFEPGRDASGKPIASSTLLTIAWEMPPEKKKAKSR